MTMDEYHKHELMDRIHCVNEMFQSLVVEHLAADLLRKEIDAAAKVLGDLYQAAGNI